MLSCHLICGADHDEQVLTMKIVAEVDDNMLDLADEIIRWCLKRDQMKYFSVQTLYGTGWDYKYKVYPVRPIPNPNLYYQIESA